MNARRRRISCALCAALLTVPSASLLAQVQGRTYRVAYWGLEPARPPVRWVEQGLARRGFVVGTNAELIYRFAPMNAPIETRATVARSLVDAKPDVILVEFPFAPAMKDATASIPIVFHSEPDPVVSRLVKDLRRPGWNATGTASMYLELGEKRLEAARALLPKATRVALLADYDYVRRFERSFPADLEAAASRLGLRLLHFDLDPRKGGTLAATLGSIRSSAPDAVLVYGVIENQPWPETLRMLQEFETSHRIPFIGDTPYYGVVRLGWDFEDNRQRVLDIVGKVLRGAAPAETPVDRNSRFLFVVDLKTAKAIGVEVPPLLMLRADRVITGDP